MTDIIYVAIVDDDPFYREILKAQLVQYKNIRIVIEASDGNELIVLLRKHKIDIVLLDLDMPVMDGIETIKYLTKHYRDIKSIILTLHSDTLKSYDLIINKARGFLHKNREIDKVSDAIYAVHKGIYYIEGSWDLSKILEGKKKNERKNNEAIKKTKDKFEQPTAVKFSTREIDVLKLILKDYTPKEISNTLFISTKTVYTHQKSMLQKADCKSLVSLVSYVYENEIIKRS